MNRTRPRYSVITGCRSCGSPDLRLVLDLGEMPLADGLVRPGSERESESRYPLSVAVCDRCALMQIRETVDPEILYGDDYPYYSSFSDALVRHAKSNVHEIIERKSLGSESLVVEIASNDGYLLQWFVARGIPVLGIDPADGPATAAGEKGIPTIQRYFDEGLAQELAVRGDRADVIIGNNVLAHVPDQNALVAAMATLLAPRGTIVMEFPYVLDLVDRCEFDTIYHEHHCYFSVTTVKRLFGRHGLNLVRVERIDIHGGSLRVWFERDAEADTSVSEALRTERDRGTLNYDFYSDFAQRVDAIRESLVGLLSELRDDGARVAAYGAAAKGATLLNYCGIDETLIDYVVDRNVHKQGWEMPGVPLQIKSPEVLLDDRPDYLLLLAWNFKDEIMKQQAEYANLGGQFIVPIPVPTVV